MTRANITIITRQGKFQFQGNSSMYPSNTMGDIFKFATSTINRHNGKIDFWDEPGSCDLSTFIEECGLTLGQIGNPSYYYEIDFKTKLVKVWDYKMRWVSAPIDWEAKGWRGCYDNGKGKFGYDSVVKGKLLYSKGFRDMIRRYTAEREVILNKTELKKALEISN